MLILYLTRREEHTPACLFLNRYVITKMVLQIDKGPLAEFYLIQKLINLVTDVRFAQSFF